MCFSHTYLRANYSVIRKGGIEESNILTVFLSVGHGGGGVPGVQGIHHIRDGVHIATNHICFKLKAGEGGRGASDSDIIIIMS